MGSKKTIRYLVSRFFTLSCIVLVIFAALLFKIQTADITSATAYNELIFVAGNKAQGKAKQDVPTIDWESLKAINPEVVAWINVPQKDIDFPVVQASENTAADFYLKHDVYGNYTKLGCPFIYKHVPKDAQNLLIFGHHLAAETMFSKIGNTYIAKNFDSIGTGYYLTDVGKCYYLEPLISINVPMTNQDIQTYEFIDTEEFTEWLVSLYKSNFPKAHCDDYVECISACKKVITLITCKSAYFDLDQRTAVVFSATELQKFLLICEQLMTLLTFSNALAN